MRLARSAVMQNKTLLIGALVLLVAGFTMYSSMSLLNFEFSLDNNNLQQEQQQLQPHQGKEQQHRQQLGQQLGQQHGHTVSDPSRDETPPTPPPLLLDPSTKYLSFLPFAGLTNQFIGVEIAAYIALRLNRTLLVPPIISNIHDHDNTHQSWSRYFDFKRFSNLTGIPVVEWDTVRPLNAAQTRVGRERALGGGSAPTEEWLALATDMTCQIIYGYGNPVKEINSSARSFVSHFFLNLIFQAPPAPAPGAQVYDHHQYAKDELNPESLVIMEDLIERYAGFQDQMLLLSHTFKIKDPQNRYWRTIGQHLHFEPVLAKYARERVMNEIREDSGAAPERAVDPESVDREEVDRIPYIAIHLRRGDILSKCTGAHEDPTHCEVPISSYAEVVERVRAGLRHKRPVVVTTDSDSMEELEEMKSLGWHRIDHSEDDVHEALGAFGPAFVDASILAHADVFLGSVKSTMSRVAANRQLSWYHRSTIYPQAPGSATKESTAADLDESFSRMRRSGIRRL
ncbi:hypothetical protein BG006_006252 [Podila minutissima]|uniref:GDP-fucose protein O-fucosyltransferase 2 n=1 Tax=Podila minutissima TaxID=64525 RepID=A0A9P5SIT1_9FUNG|nr:hypothetical protein BG006_006252 [Podila minutissima]